LLTRWVAKAAAEMHLKSKKEGWKYFEKTGCLIDIVGVNDHKIHPEGFHLDYFKCLTNPRQPSIDSSVSISIKDLISRPPMISSSSSTTSESSLEPSSSLSEEHKEPVEELDTSDDFFDCDLDDSDDTDVEDTNEVDSRVVRVVVGGKICVYNN